MATQSLQQGQQPKSIKRSEKPYLFLFIPLGVLALVSFVPLFYAIYIATHSIILTAPQLGRPFVGLDNFVRVLTTPRSLNAFLVTAKLLLMSVGAAVILGVAMAVLIYNNFKSRAWMAVLLVLPMAIPKVVSGLVWNILYNPLIGVINFSLQAVGLPEVDWLSNSSMALVSIAIVDIWQWTPFIILIVMAGLEAVPGNFYEAAHLEGATDWQVFRYITLPLIQPFITVAVLFRSIEALRTFDYIYVLTRGGPGVATETIDIYAYNIGIAESGDISTATAAALILLVITLVGSTIWVKMMNWGEEVF